MRYAGVCVNIADVKTRVSQGALRKVSIYNSEYILLGAVSTLEYYYWMCYDGGKIRYFSIDAPIVFFPQKGMNEEDWMNMRKNTIENAESNGFKIVKIK